MLALGKLRVPMAFDADGSRLDERVDFHGDSPNSLSQRYLRDVEAVWVRRAVFVLTRTSRGAQILQARAGAGTGAGKFQVVGNGRDAGKFRFLGAEDRTALKRQLGLPTDTPLLIYAGSIGAQYCVPE